MDDISEALGYAVAGAFTLLAAGALLRARRSPDRVRNAIGAAIGVLALVTILGRVSALTGYRYRVVGDVSVVGLMLSGYLLLRFRGMLLPLARIWHGLALGAAAVTSTGVILARLDYGPSPRYTGADSVAIMAIVVVWGILTCEPIYRFWRSSRRRPPVQRARLRALALGYGALVTILLVGGGTQSQDNESIRLSIQIVALLLVPFLHASLAPPAWLRRAWRASEEEALRRSGNLIHYASERSELAERALGWAIRLVGGDGGIIVAEDGGVLARDGTTSAWDEAVGDPSPRATHLVSLPAGAGYAIVAPIPTAGGRGTLVVFSGPFVALFGSDEIDRLGDYAAELGIALDRVRLTEEIHRLDAARREFIANAAHELRTPLTTILGFSSMLVESDVNVPGEQLEAAVHAIHRQGLRMRSLINNLLDLAQIEQGKMRVSLQTISLAEVAAQTIETTAPPPGSRLDLRIPEDITVVADPPRLEQVLANLLGNAYKYGGGSVRIEASPRDGETVLVAVSDDGPGVPAEIVQRLFDPFARGTGDPRTDGSGLGLAIARSLVQAFGGEIWYEPGVPRGSTFAFTLRRAA